MSKRRAVGVVKAPRASGGVRKVQTSETKVHLPQPLRDVARGNTPIITRHGRRIARIVPELELDRTLGVVLELDRQKGRIVRQAVGVGRKG